MQWLQVGKPAHAARAARDAACTGMPNPACIVLNPSLRQAHLQLHQLLAQPLHSQLVPRLPSPSCPPLLS